MVEQAVKDFLSPESGGKERLDALNTLSEIVSAEGFALPSPSHSVFHDVVLSLVSAVAAPSQSIRIMGLRVTRALLKTSASNIILEALLERNIAYFLTGCLERSKQVTGERMQALKLVSQLANASPLLMPRIIAQSLLSIAKQTDDPFSILCVEIIAQLAMGNPGLVGSIGGMNFLFHEIVHMENYHENRQAALVAVATFLCNDAPTRRHLDLHNMGAIVEPFTDSYSGQDLRKKKWTSARTAITYFLRSWTGLICLASTPLGLASMVDALSLQDLNLNDRVLDCIFMIFHLPLPKVTDAGFNRAKAAPDMSVLSRDPLPYERHSLLGNYRAVLLVVFHNVQLVETLIKLCRRMNARSIVEEGVASRTIARKATLLVAELLHLSNTLLPTSLCAKLQGLPDLMRDAITFTLDPHLRSLAGTTIGDLEKLALIQRANASRDTSKLDYFDEVKKNFDWTMDESTVKHKLNESVLLKKDFSQWHWDIISEMIEGPLSNPVHYNTPLATRFIKKILSFYRPSNKAFCNLPASGNEKYARIGCELVALILKHNNESVLIENPLFAQVSEMLREVYESDKKGTLGEMLSEEHLLRTMTPGYFQMLGTLSETKQGVEVMHKHKIFNHLVPCAILPGRDGLCNMIIENLDYNQPGPSRVLLAKSLGAQSRVVRYLSTKRLQYLMRSGVSDFSEWGIRFLVQKLSDEDQKVSSFALSILEEACYDTNHLESLINKRAFETLQAMGKSGKDLLLRFLSRASGFNYLSSTNFVRNELVFWKARGYVNYVERVESALADAFNSAVWRKEYHEVPIPVHLYGELVQTKEGIKLLEQNGDFKEFTSLLCSPNSSSIQKRGALWVLGHIGRTKMGYKEIFPKYSVLKLILHVARTCSCLSVRGTCFYVLGLICNIRSAANALHSLGWESNREGLICVPSSVEACGVFQIKESETSPAWPGDCPQLETPQYGDARDQLIKEFTNLSNNLTFDKSAKAIKALKTEHPEAFRDPEVQMHVFRLMENYSYALPPRRYFQQIFSVFWSTERIKALPSYPLPDWKLPKEEFATISPFHANSTWSVPDTNKKSNRRLKTAGSRRESVSLKSSEVSEGSGSESGESEKTLTSRGKRKDPAAVAAVRTKSTPPASSAAVPLRKPPPPASQDSSASSTDAQETRYRPPPPKRLSRCDRGTDGRAATATFTSAVPSANASRRLSRPPPPPRPLKDGDQ